MTAGAPLAAFEVEEVLIEGGGLIVLSLGFASPEDPFDVLHIVSGPKPTGDALYLERTDQSLACQGADILRIERAGDAIILRLSEKGSGLVHLPPVTRFLFSQRPDLLDVAVRRLAQIAAVGHADVIVI